MSFNRVRSRGSSPSELDRTEIVAVFRRHSSPLAIGFPASATTRRSSGKNAGPGLAPGCASLQGLDPSAGWGIRARISPHSRAPGSPGFPPPWGVPLPNARPRTGFRLPGKPGRHGRRTPVPASPCSRRRPTGTSASSRALQERGPFWILFPVLQSIKEPGSWLASPEAAGPYEVPVLVPN
jgi:hypothetical protein